MPTENVLFPPNEFHRQHAELLGSTAFVIGRLLDAGMQLDGPEATIAVEQTEGRLQLTRQTPRATGEVDYVAFAELAISQLQRRLGERAVQATAQLNRPLSEAEAHALTRPAYTQYTARQLSIGSATIGLVRTSIRNAIAYDSADSSVVYLTPDSASTMRTVSLVRIDDLVCASATKTEVPYDELLTLATWRMADHRPLLAHVLNGYYDDKDDLQTQLQAVREATWQYSWQDFDINIASLMQTIEQQARGTKAARELARTLQTPRTDLELVAEVRDYLELC